MEACRGREAARPGNQASARRVQDECEIRTHLPWVPLGMENCFCRFDSSLLYKIRVRSKASPGGQGTVCGSALLRAWPAAVPSGGRTPVLPVVMPLHIICSPVEFSRLVSCQEACWHAPSPALVQPAVMQSERHSHLAALG